MKNVLTEKLRTLKRMLPTWSYGDIGSTAGRDWYILLMLALVLGSTLIAFDVAGYQNARTIITQDASTLPIRGLPATEEDIQSVWELFRVRNTEFETYKGTRPIAPSLENAPVLSQESILDADVSVETQ